MKTATLPTPTAPAWWYLKAGDRVTVCHFLSPFRARSGVILAVHTASLWSVQLDGDSDFRWFAPSDLEPESKAKETP